MLYLGKVIFDMKKEKEGIEINQLNWFQRNVTHLFMMMFLIICFLGEAFIDLSDSLFQFALGAGLITWLIKAIGNQHFKKELEVHKHQLNLRSQDYQSELKKDLQKHELELKYIGNKANLLLIKQANVLEELYEKIILTNNAIKRMIPKGKIGYETYTIKEQEDENIKKVLKEFQELLEYFQRHKIYFEKDITDQIANLNDSFKTVISEYMSYNRINPSIRNWSDKQIENFELTWNTSISEFDNKTPIILEHIEIRFRDFLGV